jgi:hypothetical protein
MKLPTILLLAMATVTTTACMTPMGIAYSTTSTATLVTTGQTTTEHIASKLTDSDCSIWNAVVDFAYICEYNRNPAVTYNRNPY